MNDPMQNIPQDVSAQLYQLQTHQAAQEVLFGCLIRAVARTNPDLLGCFYEECTAAISEVAETSQKAADELEHLFAKFVRIEPEQG